MSDFRILVVEDDKWYADLLKYHLELNPEWSVHTVHNGQELLDNLSPAPDVITLDYSLPDHNADELLKKIRSACPKTEVIIVSGQEDVRTAVHLLREGVYDYIVKEEDTKERLWRSISNIKENCSLRAQVEQLREEVGKKYDFSKSIIGSSGAIRSVFKLLEKAASSSINVSITGETGTGKEVIAKAIHYNSPRSSEPFVAVNVSAIPSDLMESELFGHEKGAFTGATNRRIGKFEEAGKGTIFLDEIGEMDLNMQAKLLRVLQERELTRVGGNELVDIKSRIICATHKKLHEEVQKGTFREDLYYRLIGLPVELPPLRQRKEDIVLLARHFISEFALTNEVEEKRLNEGAYEKLLSHSYPGNVRELKAIIDLSMVLSDEDHIGPECIEIHSADPMGDLRHTDMTMREFEHRILRHYLDKYDNNVLQVAEILDIGKSTIYRMLKEN